MVLETQEEKLVNFLKNLNINTIFFQKKVYRYMKISKQISDSIELKFSKIAKAMNKKERFIILWD